MSNKQGEKFYKFVKDSGIKQEHLAEKMGVSRQTLASWFKLDRLSNKAIGLIKQHTNFYQDFTESHQIFGEAGKKGVPFYDIDVSASDIKLFTDNPERPSLYMMIPGFDDCDFAVPVFGSSMYPTYENGVVVACKQITDKSLVQFGECYLIVTSDHRMVKRLIKTEKDGVWIAASDNNSLHVNGSKVYGDLLVSSDKVLQLYIIKGCVKRSQL